MPATTPHVNLSALRNAMAATAAPSLVVPPAPPPLVAVPDLGKDLGRYIDTYLKLRDKKASITKKHKEELAPLNNALELLENGFLQHLNTTGTDSAAVKGVGTAYKTTKRSATIADAGAFRRFVIGGEQWDLVDWRANAPAVGQFIEQNGDVVPGVNFTTISDVNIRKS